MLHCFFELKFRKCNPWTSAKIRRTSVRTTALCVGIAQIPDIATFHLPDNTVGYLVRYADLNRKDDHSTNSLLQSTSISFQAFRFYSLLFYEAPNNIPGPLKDSPFGGVV